MKVWRLLSMLVMLPIMAVVCQAQQSGPFQIQGLNKQSQVESIGDTNFFYHGALLSNATATITMDNGSADQLNGEVVAQGDVTILDHGHIWRGTNFIYNFKTGDIRANTFKTGQEPFMLTGQAMKGSTNNVYAATNSFMTTDDVSHPAYTIRARSITIALGEYFEAHQATLFWGRTPVFYFPYYKRYLGQHPNNWTFEPGFRTLFGAYLLSSYNWYGNGFMDGSMHFDMRESRGLAGGPDLRLHLGNWGEAAFSYYYAADQNPNADGFNAPHLSEDRQIASFYWDAHPASNFTAKVVVDWLSDPLVIHDFFEGRYNTNVEPASFAEVNQAWPNYSVDVLVQPQVVSFYETMERLPDVKLTGLRQQVGETPLFYENESSVGYFHRSFSDTNTVFFLTNSSLIPGMPGYLTTNGIPHDYGGSRLDTFHQFTLPETFFDWLNVTPKLGGRLTYYSDVDGPYVHTNEQLRALFNTGVDISTKISKVYKDAECELLDVNGIRHIIEPDVDYVYIPAPTRSPSQVPQYDYQTPSIGLLPIDFPDNNNIDDIGATDVVRLSLRNKLQTKRANGTEDLLNLAVYTDVDLSQGTNHHFSDLYSDLTFRPRSWIRYTSSIRYDMVSNRWHEAIESIMLQPSTAWSLSVAYRYLINNDPEFLQYVGENLPGHNLIVASLYYRLNENWGVHIAEQYEAQYGGMQQQIYSIYRDMRSWTASLMLRVTQGPGQPTDFTIAMAFSLKAFPRYTLGSDADRIDSPASATSLLDPYSSY